ENIEAVYQKFNPGYPFAYKFIESDYLAMYEAERRVAFLSKYFAAIAIIISCLGLFGLTYFTAQKRQKEISIRKVLGASPLGIVQLLSKDFLSLVALAVGIAIPVAWLLMRQWLNRFVFRIEMEWWIFALAGIGALLLALLTISLHSFSAANSDPAKTLRSE
ncbi:MAG: FtsX-like permease family protein, partial [Bacteroidota bacterium]